MKTIHIALPDSLEAFVEKQLAGGAYADVSEYVQALVRAHQKAKNRDDLELALLEGLEGGPSEEMNAADWRDIRRQVRENLQARDRR